MSTLELPEPDPATVAAQDWVADYVGRRRIASDEAYRLLVEAERAKRRGDLDEMAALTVDACQELGRIGMHGPVIEYEIQRMRAAARREVAEQEKAFALIAGRLAHDLPYWNGERCPNPVAHHRLERDAAQERRVPVVHVDGLCDYCGGSTKGGWR